MKQYREYKDSGVKWIGDIPSHWEMRRAMNMVEYHQSGAWGDDELHNENDRICLRIADFDFENCSFKKGLDYTKRNYAKNQIEKLRLNKGDILIEKSGGGDKMPVGRAVIFDLELKEPLYANFMEKLSLRNFANSKFYVFFLKDLYGKGIVWKYIKQTTGLQNLDLTSLLNSELFVFPPLPEQQAIVSYLDAKVSKIDRYIATATKKIAALDELKQVTIANAVTKGINPNAPMKDSGIPWIGMVPENWKTLRAKNIFERQFREVKDDDDIVTCFRDGQVTLRKNRRTDGFTESIKEIGYQGIRKGDLVIHQMDAFAGSIGVSDSDGKGTPVYICCLPKGESNVFYYAYLLREMARTGFIKSLYRGIRERSSDFRFETFAVQWLPVFPLSEQNEIVTYIDRKVAQIDQMRTAELSQIEKLKEYKQRLISDVVTGKVKVTND